PRCRGRGAWWGSSKKWGAKYRRVPPPKTLITPALFSHRPIPPTRHLTVETPRGGGNPRWGRLRSGDNGSIGKKSSRRLQGKSRSPVPADSLRGVGCYRRLGDAPTGGSPRHGASLHYEAGDCRETVRV